MSDIFNSLKDQNYIKRIDLLRKRNTKLIKKYLKYADSDIKSSRLLHQNHELSLSTFHLQQAIEKVMKAYALYFGLVTNNEIRRHDPQIFVRLLKERWVQTFPKSIDPRMGVDTTKLYKIMDERDEYAHISEEDFNTVKGWIENFKKTKNNPIPKITFKITKKKRLDLGEMKNLILSATNMTICICLFFLSWMHEQSTRYPDNNLKINLTPEDYDQNLVIVKHNEYFLDNIEIVRSGLFKIL